MIEHHFAPVLVNGLGFILFMAVGLLGTFWARAVQAYELNFYNSLNPFVLLSFLQEYVGSELYLWQVRIIGVACLVAAAALFYALLNTSALPMMRV